MSGLISWHTLRENYLKRLRVAGDENAAELRDSIVGLRDAAFGSKTSMLDYAKTVGKTRAMNVQRDLNVVWDRLLEVANRIIEDQDAVIAFTTDVLAEIDRRVPIQSSSKAAISSQDQT